MRNILWKGAIFLALSFSFQIAKAQDETSSKNTKPHIEVTGIAEQTVTPDEIYLNIVIK